MPTLTPETVFRRYETDGVPDSGNHEPIKAEIIQLFNQLFGTSRGGWVVARTLVELNGIVPPAETDGGVVLTGPGSGYYDREGGFWVFGRGFPDTFARIELSGSAAAQTGVVNVGVDPSSIEVFFAKVVTPNSGPLTLSISGGPALPVINIAGNPLAPGEWTGMVMFHLSEDGEYQLLIDAGAAQSAALSVGYAREWAQSDDPISPEAGGDGATDHSAKFYSAQSANARDDSEAFAQAAQDLVTEATAGFSGFLDGQGYDFGSITSATTYFDQDWGSLV